MDKTSRGEGVENAERPLPLLALNVLGVRKPQPNQRANREGAREDSDEHRYLPADNSCTDSSDPENEALEELVEPMVALTPFIADSSKPQKDQLDHPNFNFRQLVLGCIKRRSLTHSSQDICVDNVLGIQNLADMLPEKTLH